MVSVVLSSLPDKYIEASKLLIQSLESSGFSVEYAYWYLQYDEHETWIDGDWRFLIVSECVNKYGLKFGYEYLQEILSDSDVNVIELQDISLDGKSEGEVYKHFVLERIDIK